jgi:EpsI family protein
MSRRMIILSILFFCGWLFIARTSRMELVPIGRPLIEFPLKVDNWMGQQQPPLSDDILANLGVDDYLNRTYYRAGSSSALDFYVGFYQYQKQGKAIHSPLNCLPGAGWNPVRREYVSISVQDSSNSTDRSQSNGSRNIEANRVVIDKGLEKQVVIYWYQSHGRVIASEYLGRIYSVLDALRTNRTDAALVRIMSPVRGLERKGEDEAERLAVDFVKSMFPKLNLYLPQ